MNRIFFGPGENLDEPILGGVRVLVLVHKDVTETPPVVLSKIRIGGE